MSYLDENSAAKAAEAVGESEATFTREEKQRLAVFLRSLGPISLDAGSAGDVEIIDLCDEIAECSPPEADDLSPIEDILAKARKIIEQKKEEFRLSPDIPLEVEKGETPDSYITRSLAAYRSDPAAVRTSRVNLLVPFGLSPASLEEMRPLKTSDNGFPGLLRICEMIVALDRYMQNFCGFTQSEQEGDLERSLQDCSFDLSSGTKNKITAAIMPVVERFNEYIDDPDNKAAFLDLIDMQDGLYDFLRLSGVIVKMTGNEALDAIRYLISVKSGEIGNA